MNEALNFLVTIIFAFLIGLEVKSYFNKKDIEKVYTFLAIGGYLFYKIDTYLFIAGFIVFSLALLKTYKELPIYLIAAIVYSLGALENSIWLLALIFVIIVFLLSKQKLMLNSQEIKTLSKFILLSIVILPLLPKTPIKFIDISPFKIWLGVVIVSGISYISYILSKYIFKEKGFLIAAILGGLYSSTATTVVLAKKITPQLKSVINASIIIATAMMYIRLIAITFIFNPQIAKNILMPFLIFAILGIVISLFYYKKEKISIKNINQNPLELQTAFIFAILFVLMMALTKLAILYFGEEGLKILAFIAGLSDIDPFILSLLMGKYKIPQQEIIDAIFIATGSNNILKAIYAYIFGKKEALISSFWLILFGVATILLSFI